MEPGVEHTRAAKGQDGEEGVGETESRHARVGVKAVLMEVVQSLGAIVATKYVEGTVGDGEGG